MDGALRRALRLMRRLISKQLQPGTPHDLEKMRPVRRDVRSTERSRPRAAPHDRLRDNAQQLRDNWSRLPDEEFDPLDSACRPASSAVGTVRS